MKPPAADALDRAIQILIESVANENGNTRWTFSEHDPAAQDPAKVARTDDLSTLRSSYDALSLINQAISTELDSRMRRLGRSINYLLPINSLPTELMIDVLVASMDQAELGEVQRLKYLSRVQIAWRNLIRSSPHFWTRLCNGCPNIPLKIRKSGEFGLQVDFGYHISGVKGRTFLELALSQKQRWESVRYQGRESEALAQILAPPLPKLRNIELGSRSFNPYPLDFSCAPLLRRVSIQGFYIPRPLPQLAALEIKHLNYAELSLTLLQDAILSNPGLKVLVLEHLRTHDARQLSNVPFLLPHLEDLAIRDVTPELALNILARIRSDNIRRVEVEDVVLGLGSEPTEIISNLFASPILLAPFRQGRLAKVTIVHDLGKLSLKAQSDDGAARFAVSLTSEMHSLRPLLGEIAGQLPIRSLNIPVHLRMNERWYWDAREEDNNLVAFLDQFPTLTTITFDQLPYSIALAAVAHLRHRKNEDPSWACPALKAVIVTDALGDDWTMDWRKEFLTALADMAVERTRCERDAGSGITFYQLKHGRNGTEVLIELRDIRKLPPF